ncbi:hypothetical protein EC991_008273 [Linnemannia zychae]|nr:hypothetical protein EC991_008273 [Linnemannia zychae]
MARFPEVTRLWWHAEYGRDRKNQWQKLVELVKTGTEDREAGPREVGPSDREAEPGKEPDYGFKDCNLLRSSNFNDSVSWNMLERPLQELRLSGYLDIQVRLTPLLPFMRFVTVLKLTMKMETSLDLCMVLTQCPDLQVLHIRTTSTFRLLGPWVPRDISVPIILSLQSSQQQEQQQEYSQEQEFTSKQDSPLSFLAPKVLALRELVLERAHFYQASLERLLCITPKLDTLRLIDLNRHSWLSSYPTPVEYDQYRLIRFLQSPSFPQPKILPLKSFSFSIASKANPHHDRDIKSAHKELSPDSQEWTLFVEDLSSVTLRYLREEVPNVVTTLELWYNDMHMFSNDVVLHRYMCSSPHLLHLKARNTFYLVDLLDIHGRIESATAGIKGGPGVGVGTRGTNSRTGPPGIWTCKNLQTLHLSFRTAGYINSTVGSITGGTLKVTSRIVFGYISRVCPELKDLQLRAAEDFFWAPWSPHGNGATSTNRHRLHLTLDSGLCLLARLNKLEEFGIGFISWSRTAASVVSSNMAWNLMPVDLDWMLEEGHRDTRRRETRRRVVAERWEHWLDEERVAEVQKTMQTNWWVSRTRKMLPHNSTTAKAVFRPALKGRTDPEIHEQLKDLGLLVDVKNILEEMEIEDERLEGQGEGGWFKCWPMLRWMRIYHSADYGRSREREVQRLTAQLKELKYKHKAY